MKENSVTITLCMYDRLVNAEKIANARAGLLFDDKVNDKVEDLMKYTVYTKKEHGLFSASTTKIITNDEALKIAVEDERKKYELKLNVKWYDLLFNTKKTKL